MSRDPASLADIRRACRLVLQFKGSIGAEDLKQDLEKQSAIVYQLMVVGEATKRLSAEFRASHPGMPWSEIAGMRDRLIHGYDEIDLNLVWEAIEKDVPELLRFVEPLVPEENES